MTTFINEQNESNGLLNEIASTDITVAAGTDGLLAGNLQDALQLLASRISALEHAAGQNGRIIPVGTGTGALTIDGDQLSLNGNPITLQANDVIEIQAGTYQWIDVSNVTFSGAGVIYVKNKGLVIINEGGFNLNGNVPVKNVVFDFASFPGLEYGLKNTFTGPQERFHIDTHSMGGYENITIRGLEFVNVWDRGMRLGSHNVDYLNTGKKAISGLLIEKCRFISDNTPEWGGGIDLGGELNYETGTDRGYIENVVIRDIKLIGGEGQISLGNANNYEIYNITVDKVNPTATHHARIVFAQGWGEIHHIKGTEHYGNLTCQWVFTRGNVPAEAVVSNVIAYKSRKYSATEFQSFNRFLWPNRTTFCHGKALGITAVDMGTNLGVPAGNEYTSTAIDIYGMFGAEVTVKDSVAIHPYNCTTVSNGPISADSSNNLVYADHTGAKLIDFISFKPASDSPLIGAGITDADLTDDYYGVLRALPPTVGAVEG
ncbi:hypothetical protein [Pedobacter sp. KBW06]|uniref:hypothetical protein n=1 Tax=Pedobacter sp. KBW06 TaxID=2153359 RepID=UPI000F5B543F|nr:hypothetical protein [Pedobacter sp. KBW06]